MNRSVVVWSLVVGFVSSLVTWLINDVVHSIQEGDQKNLVSSQLSVLQANRLIVAARLEKLGSDIRSVEDQSGRRIGYQWDERIDQQINQLQETFEKMSDELVEIHDVVTIDIAYGSFDGDLGRVFKELEIKIPAVEANIERIREEIKNLPVKTPKLQTVI